MTPPDTSSPNPRQPADLADWLQTPMGRYVTAWEEKQLDAMVADLFGYHAVQIGLTQFDFLRNNRIPSRTLCDFTTDGRLVDVLASSEALPFESGSVDLVLLPHALEFAEHPHQVLREVERILVPEGQLIVAGFNPYSLWGARRLAQRRVGAFPWQGQYLSVRRLKDWLQLLSFDTRGGGFGCYAPPMRQQRWLDRFNFMDAAGERWWPVCGGVYLLQAVKRVHSMRLIQPKWRTRSARRKSLAPVASPGQRVARIHRKQNDD
ncbi:MAG: class I SAM-dependent methyltransferase [Denitromonas halophila]|nr:MAG: class I SAM-dependent methyltransferase [Denitromonas halophila]